MEVTLRQDRKWQGKVKGPDCRLVSWKSILWPAKSRLNRSTAWIGWYAAVYILVAEVELSHCRVEQGAALTASLGPIFNQIPLVG